MAEQLLRGIFASACDACDARHPVADRVMQYEQPQNIRVFISSTFLDLAEEREYLVKHVFPEIRHICRERGLLFTEIDLRWGITQEDSSFGRVISTCLQEIDRCRPFFIGILGERYGWMPEMQDIHKNAYLVEEHRWLEEAVLEGMSLVEMEFNYAALNSLEPMPGAFFYLAERERDPSLIPRNLLERSQSEELKEVAESKLTNLKKRIRSGAVQSRSFTTPEELGAHVREDLLRTIELLHPTKTEQSPLAIERQRHEAFSLSRRQAYIARVETLHRLTDHTLGDDQPLVVHGVSGLGKSALLAYWSRFFGQRHPNMAVLVHFIGSVSTDNGHEGLLRRILSEIKELFAVEEAVPDTLAGMERAFPAWLAKVPEKRLVLVVDALNQLDAHAAKLDWLPHHLPSNVRIIFSTTPGPTLDALRTRGWPEFELLPLTEPDRTAMITRFLSEFRKALAIEDANKIASNSKTSNPLFLRTLLEELRLTSAYKRLAERIEDYLSAETVGDLFEQVLERIERDFGAPLIRRIMILVWASKEGLSENDFIALNDLLRSEASLILIALEFHLVQRQGYLRFFHDYLREAVESRYLESKESKLEAHSILGRYYATEPTSERRAEELPWQFIEAEMWDELHDWLIDIPEFMRYVNDDSQWKYIGYWLKLGDRFDMVESYRQAVAAWRKKYYTNQPPDVQFAGVLDRIGKFLMACGKYNGAELLLAEALDIMRERYGVNHLETAKSLNTLGTLYQTSGEYNKAEPLLEQALSILETSSEPNSPTLVKALNSFAELIYKLGKYAEAKSLLERAVKIAEENFGANHYLTIESLANLGTMLYSTSKLDEAQNIYDTALGRAKIAWTDESTAYATLASNLAAVERKRGNFDQSEVLYRRALGINGRLLGPIHPETSRNLQNLAFVLKSAGRLDDAETLYRRALQISRTNSEQGNPAAALNLARLLIQQENFDEAEALLLGALGMAEKSGGPNHPLTAITQLHRARLLERQGRFEGALELFRRYIPMLKTRDSSREETAEHYNLYISLLRRLGEDGEASKVEERLQQL